MGIGGPFSTWHAPLHVAKRVCWGGHPAIDCIDIQYRKDATHVPYWDGKDCRHGVGLTVTSATGPSELFPTGLLNNTTPPSLPTWPIEDPRSPRQARHTTGNGRIACEGRAPPVSRSN